MEQVPSEIILDVCHSPIKGKEHWPWFTIMGDEDGIISLLKALASCTLNFSLLVPPGINTERLTIAREKAREIITPSIFFGNDEKLWAFLDEDVNISLFPSYFPWDGMREFEDFLRLATSSPPSLVVLPSRWKRLLPSIKEQTHLPVQVLNEQGMVPRVYLGYEKSKEQQAARQKGSSNDNTDIKYPYRRRVIRRMSSEKKK